MKIRYLKNVLIIVMIISNYTAKTQNIKNRSLATKTIHPKCLQAFIHKKGTVFSIMPKVVEFTSNYNNIKINLVKKGGKAKTKVNIYVNKILKETLFIDTAKNTKQISKELFKVKNKNIKIELINLSDNLKLEYSLIVYGNSNSLLYGTDTPKKGNLNPKQSISLTIANSCTKKYFVVAERINGNAKCELIINGKTKKIMKESDKKITYKLSSEEKTPSITLKNIDLTKTITYKINVLTNL